MCLIRGSRSAPSGRSGRGRAPAAGTAIPRRAAIRADRVRRRLISPLSSLSHIPAHLSWPGLSLPQPLTFPERAPPCIEVAADVVGGGGPVGEVALREKPGPGLGAGPGAVLEQV